MTPGPASRRVQLQNMPLSLRLFTLVVTSIVCASAHEKLNNLKWAAVWTAAPSGVYSPSVSFPGNSTALALYLRPESNHALPDGKAFDQSFRMIIKPDLWGDTVRIRFSNVFGDSDLSIAAATVGLQESAAQLVAGTNNRITFSGKPDVIIPAGQEVFSDPLRLSFVTQESKRWLSGRNLAVSYYISGRSGLLTIHNAATYSYMTWPGSGDQT